MFKLKKFLCFLFVFVLLFLNNILFVFADDQTLTNEYFNQQSNFIDISFLPVFPELFIDPSIVSKIILYDSDTQIYSLYLSKYKVTYFEYWDAFISGTNICPVYYYDSKLINSFWSSGPSVQRFYLGNKKIFYSNVDIPNLSHPNNKKNIHVKRYRDFTVVSVALASFQTYIKKYLNVLLPFGVSIFITFILLRLLSKFFKPKDKYKSKMYKQKMKFRKRFLR